jgi:hypothetical protein
MCLAVAQALVTGSHGRLKRMLMAPGPGIHSWTWPCAPCSRLWEDRGYLRVDETIVERPYAARLEEAAWVWSIKHNKMIFGIPVALLVWTNGRVRIPLAF